jgi:hypothetical protein
VLLALVVALRADRSEALGRARGPTADAAASAAPGTPIVVYSAGADLPPLELRRRPMHDAVILDGALLSTDPLVSGLRALRMDRGRRIDAYRNFDTARNPAAVDALERFARATPTGGVLVLSAAGPFAPQGELAARRRDGLRKLLERLGREADPTGSPSPSRCLVTMRRRDGWELAGSAVSNVEAVRLALNVDGLERRRGGEVEPVTIDGRQLVLPLSDRPCRTSDNVEVDAQGVLFRLARGVIRNMAPDEGRGRGRVVWEDVPLGPDAAWTAGLLLREPGGGAPSLSGGEVVVDLTLDGQRIARERLQRTSQAFARPRAWRVPLRSAAAVAGRLELRIGQSLGHPALEVLVVRPLVTSRGPAQEDR